MKPDNTSYSCSYLAARPANTNTIADDIVEICAMARAVQDKALTDDQRKQKLLDVRVRYADIYSVLINCKNGQKIHDEYRGGIITPGIVSFLDRGWMRYKYSHLSPSMPAWAIDVDRSFVNRINEQYILFRSSNNV